MIKTKKLLALLLALSMLLALAACGGSKPTETEETDTSEPTTTEPANEGDGENEKSADTPLVVGYSPFNEKFSPFFSETAYDQDVYAMTALPLLNSDRTGAVVYKGIEGETIEYNGTPYTYYGPADLEVTVNDDGTVYYDFTLRDDITFSDGEPVTIDDVIFSMYVYSDPTYDGGTTLYAQPIEGMNEYRSGVEIMYDLLVAAGKDNTDFTYWDEDTQTAFWDALEQAGIDFTQEIVDYCIDNDLNSADDDMADIAASWGFEVAEGGTVEDYWHAIEADYEGDYAALSSTESAGSTLWSFLPAEYSAGVETGSSAPNISGIQKTGDNTLRVVTTEMSANVIYQFTIPISPLHYYGDASLYDYDNNSFGFPKGDLSLVRAKTTQPMGAGPYKFIKFENGVVNFEANDGYFLGAPKTKYINFVQCTTDDDKLNGVATGTIDLTDPSYSTDTVDAIAQANGGEQTGDVITTDTVDNLGYGYIGMNATTMSVGGDGSSEASKNLRRAFGTIFSVYRDVAISSYYGERADVINYPISTTSWAAPRPADDGYQVAFSVDVEGNPIYTSSMSDEEKYAAAAEAALGFFEAAGYTVEDGKITAAPEGAKLEYTFWIPADGTGDHPSFMIVSEAKNALAELGINLIIKDLSNSSEMWDALDAISVEMWAAAWSATPDPDMYQIYYSDVANGPMPAGTEGYNPLGGPGQGGSNFEYCIADAELDQLIMDARASADQAYRKTVYKACLDIVIDWAVEVPVYQRQNAVIFSTERVNISTVTPDITTFYGWMNEVQNIELN